jgi:hypothetical protein
MATIVALLGRPVGTIRHTTAAGRTICSSGGCQKCSVTSPDAADFFLDSRTPQQ